MANYQVTIQREAISVANQSYVATRVFETAAENPDAAMHAASRTLESGERITDVCRGGAWEAMPIKSIKTRRRNADLIETCADYACAMG
jgi:hypothetical protein